MILFRHWQFNGERIIWTTTNEQYPTILLLEEGACNEQHFAQKITKTSLSQPGYYMGYSKRERRGSEAKPPDLGVNLIIYQKLEVPKVSNFLHVHTTTRNNGRAFTRFGKHFLRQTRLPLAITMKPALCE